MIYCSACSLRFFLAVSALRLRRSSPLKIYSLANLPCAVSCKNHPSARCFGRRKYPSEPYIGPKKPILGVIFATKCTLLPHRIYDSQHREGVSHIFFGVFENSCTFATETLGDQPPKPAKSKNINTIRRAASNCGNTSGRKTSGWA